MTIQKISIPASELVLWAEPDNINYFVKTPLVADSVEGTTNVQRSVKAHSRRQYPGDIITMNVSAHTRDVMIDPGRKVGSALPGSPFILDDGTEKRQFTFVGTVHDLHSFLLGEVNAETKLYTTGARYVIPKATGA